MWEPLVHARVDGTTTKILTYWCDPTQRIFQIQEKQVNGMKAREGGCLLQEGVTGTLIFCWAFVSHIFFCVLERSLSDWNWDRCVVLPSCATFKSSSCSESVRCNLLLYIYLIHKPTLTLRLTTIREIPAKYFGLNCSGICLSHFTIPCEMSNLLHIGTQYMRTGSHKHSLYFVFFFYGRLLRKLPHRQWLSGYFL